MGATLVLLCFILVTFLIALLKHLTRSYRGVYFGLWFKKEQLIMMVESWSQHGKVTVSPLLTSSPSPLVFDSLPQDFNPFKVGFPTLT